MSSRSDRSVSPSETVPADTESSAAMQCISVDLPDPDGPITAVNSPAAKSIDTPSSAATVGVAFAVHLADVDGAGCDSARGLGGGCCLRHGDPLWSGGGARKCTA